MKKALLLGLYKELRWLWQLSLLIYLTLSITSYNPRDPAWSQAHAGFMGPFHNFAGQAGAWVADVLLFFFGFSAYWFCVFLACCFIENVKNMVRPTSEKPCFPKIQGLLFWVLLICSCGLEFYIHQRPLPSHPGGVIGRFVGTMFYESLHPSYWILALLLVFLMTLGFFFRFSWLRIGEFLGHKLTTLFFFLRSFFQQKPAAMPAQPASTPASNTENRDFLSPVQKTSTNVERPRKSTCPSLDLLHVAPAALHESAEDIANLSRLIPKELLHFDIQAEITGSQSGPITTCYELSLAAGTKTTQLMAISRDLARALAVSSVRVIEHLPGRNTVGLELPNAVRQNVYLREILESRAFQEHPSPLAIALGKTSDARACVVDPRKMPHCLIAGTTGSGKSVALHAIILSLLFKSPPERVRLLLVDPKTLEFTSYQNMPHLLCPIMTEVPQTIIALDWVIAEMERRYKVMAQLGLRHFDAYDQTSAQTPPWLVMIIDELADLMMLGGKKVEEKIIRIAQKSRAAGIHLILSTQRPSVDIVTGLIKANVPTRMSFRLNSKIDSRIILDQAGAETLLGQGDMLYLEPGAPQILRIQGAFIAEEEIHRVARYWCRQDKPKYAFDFSEVL